MHQAIFSNNPRAKLFGGVNLHRKSAKRHPLVEIAPNFIGLPLFSCCARQTKDISHTKNHSCQCQNAAHSILKRQCPEPLSDTEQKSLQGDSPCRLLTTRSEEHTSELQSQMSNSY